MMNGSLTLVFRLGIAGLLFVITGCQTPIFHDFTRERIPENPSNIYTFEFAARLGQTNAIAGTERAQIVINGKTFDMQPSPRGDRIFTFDYAMPPGVTEARYYFILTYDEVSNNVRRTRTRFSTHEHGGVYVARLINRFTIQLLAERGPVGSTIGLVGSGFSAGDVVVVNGQEAATTFHSPISLEFTVPSLPAGRSYEVALRTGSGDIPAGMFRIDEGSFSVLPARVRLSSGGRDQMSFQIPGVAPAGGLLIDVTTDVPASIIMPEVVIPSGFSSVVIDIEGGQPGTGTLFIEAPGFRRQEIPIEVR